MLGEYSVPFTEPGDLALITTYFHCSSQICHLHSQRQETNLYKATSSFGEHFYTVLSPGTHSESEKGVEL